MIVKDELHNLPRLFESIKGCCDEIRVLDTGSTDGTKEWLEEKVKTGFEGTPVYLHHFLWCDDFAAARNAAMAPMTTDYILWLDGDDALDQKEAFLRWRDTAMGLADYWLVTYHYGFDNGGAPVCSFGRERVFRRDRQFSWAYFIHEGVVPKSPVFADIKINYAQTWAIAHKRTPKDMEQDRSRNLRILEKNKDKIDTRLRFYYGKELFDAHQYVEAIHELMEAASDSRCEPHDRILALQYAGFSYVACNQFEKAIAVSHQGLQLDPNRAEFWVCIGDCYLKMGRPQHAVPAYQAAKGCFYRAPQTGAISGMIFSAGQCYEEYPRMQLARIFVSLGLIPQAHIEAIDAAKFPNPEAKAVLDEVERIVKITATRHESELEKVDDIIISCPPGTQMYEWDPGVAAKRGIGGSETAAVQVAYWLHKLTKRPVKVFNTRRSTDVFDGVEYISNDRLAEYASQKLPFCHFSWRHTIPVSKAPNYILCHDLITPGIENTSAYEKLLCLSPFHKEYTMAMQAVPENKIWVTRNGIDTARFEGLGATPKKPGKVMFPSSPDRGLKWSMEIMDEVVKECPEAGLHVFYGFSNMRKMGQNEIADKLEAEMAKRPWVKFHGNVQQDELARQFAESEVWLYPADFIETFCITALESMAGRCWPVATRIGALQNTIGQFADIGMADLIDEKADTEGHKQIYVQKVIEAIKEKKYTRIDYPIEKLSWKSVAEEWIEKLGL